MKLNRALDIINGCGGICATEEEVKEAYQIVNKYREERDKKLTQPLAFKATQAIDKDHIAVCRNCGLVFNWLYQTKHGTCPECNSENWHDYRYRLE